jgi:ABC-type sugar transport system substrate-binding protein
LRRTRIDQEEEKEMKKALGMVLVLMMVLGLFTVASAEADKAAFITQALSNESQAYAWKQFQQYCAEYGFEMTVFEGQNDVQNEAKAVSTCIAQGFKVIFIN